MSMAEENESGADAALGNGSPKAPGRDAASPQPSVGTGSPHVSDEEESDGGGDLNMLICRMCDADAVSAKIGLCKQHNGCIRTCRNKAKMGGVSLLPVTRCVRELQPVWL